VRSENKKCGNCLCNFSLTLLFSFIICIISCTAVVVAGAAVVAERRTTTAGSVSWGGHRDGTGSHVGRGNFALRSIGATTPGVAAAAFVVVAVADRHCCCTSSSCDVIGVSFFSIPFCVCECLSTACCGTRELKTSNCRR